MNWKKAVFILLAFICVLLTVQTAFYIEGVIGVRKAFLEDLALSSDAVSQWIEPALSKPDEKEFAKYISGGKHAAEMFYGNCHVNNGAFIYNVLWHKENYLFGFTQIEVTGLKNRYMEIYNKCQDGSPLSDKDYLFLEGFNGALRGLVGDILDEEGKVKISVILSGEEFNKAWCKFIEETKSSGYYG